MLKNAFDWLDLLGQGDPPFLHDKQEVAVGCSHRSSYRSLALLVLAVVAFALSGCGSNNDKARLTATEVSWSRLASLVQDCKAKRVDQTHNNLVTVTKRDGRKERGYEPHVDAIIPIVNRAHAHCGPLIFSTE